MSDVTRPTTHPIDAGPSATQGSYAVGEDVRVERDVDTRPLPHDHAPGAHPVAHGDPVERLRSPDNRAKLLLAIAVMSALTLLLTLVMAIDHLADGGPEPVLVEGVPCLVEEGTEGDQAVLYCQR